MTTDKVRIITERYNLSPKAIRRRKIIQFINDCLVGLIFVIIYIITGLLLGWMGVS